MKKIAVTGASGQLGRLVIQQLIDKVGERQVVALVRDPSKLADLSARGIDVRRFDYSQPELLPSALDGVGRLLLISSSERGQREAQHRAVLEAAKRANVDFVAYTSLLHADTSSLGLAAEHLATEVAIKESGIDHAILRNGWYTENYTMSALKEIQNGGVIGSTGDGRLSTAARADYAAAAVAVLVAPPESNITFELAGDDSFTLTQYAATLAEASGKPVAYIHLTEADLRAALEKKGVPAEHAGMLAESSARAAGGALFDDGKALSRLIGRATTPLADTVRAAIAA